MAKIRNAADHAFEFCFGDSKAAFFRKSDSEVSSDLLAKMQADPVSASWFDDENGLIVLDSDQPKAKAAKPDSDAKADGSGVKPPEPEAKKKK